MAEAEPTGDIDPKNLPTHVAVIMDGNGRWAKRQGKSRSEGHRAGARALENLMDAALQLGIPIISVYAFSKENWTRPPGEVKSLFALLDEFIGKRLDGILDRNIQILHSGDLKGLPKSSRKNIETAVSRSAENTGLVMNFCVNYGGRQEILQAAGRVMRARLEKLIAAGAGGAGTETGLVNKIEKKLNKAISEKELEKHLYQKLPPPDLLIRTAGEKRVSNFLLWQIAYSEFWFTEKLWPEFDNDDLHAAVYAYQSRERRYGGI